MIRDDVAAMAAALLFLLVLTPPLMILANRYSVVGPAAFALVTRLVWGFTSLWVFGLTASDAAGYDATAQALANGDENVRLVPGKEAWPILLSYLYRWFGHTPEAGLILNAAVAASLPIVMVLICRSFGWGQAEKPAAWLVVVFPAMIPWTSLLLRESIVALLLALAVLGAAWLSSGRMIPGFALLLASTLLMVPFRGGLAFIGAVVLPSILLLEALFGKRVRRKVRLLVPVAGAAMLILALPVLSEVADQASYFDEDRQDAAAISLNRGSTSFESAGLSYDTSEEGWTQGVRALPLTSFGPAPWSWRSVPLLVVGLDGLLWVGVWALAVFGLRASRNVFHAALCIIPTLLLLVYVGTLGTNFGLVMRLRALGIPLLAPLVGLGIAFLLDARPRRQQEAQSPDGTPDSLEPGQPRKTSSHPKTP